MKISFFVTAVCILLLSCRQSDCEKLNPNFSTYSSAISKIRSTDFSLQEKINTDSSWIDSIEYYSCDSQTGFLIINTKREQSYIHSGVPIQVWEEFKDAPSYGRYYKNHISGNYYFVINHE